MLICDVQAYLVQLLSFQLKHITVLVVLIIRCEPTISQECVDYCRLMLFEFQLTNQSRVCLWKGGVCLYRSSAEKKIF